MPPYPFLFERRAVEVEMPYDALQFPPEFEVADRYVAPTARATALAAYLLSLDASHPVPEVAR